MAIYNYTITRPNQALQAGSVNALALARFSGLVEGTIKRYSIMRGEVSVQTVRGTNTITKKAIGRATLQKVVPGETPSGTGFDYSKAQVTVNATILSRSTIPMLEQFQTDFDVQSEIADEQGKEHAKFYDQAFLIQGVKAASQVASTYGAVGGHSGGSQVTLALAGDALDPAKLNAAINDVIVKMMEKDVDPLRHGVKIYVRPKHFGILQQSEFVTNRQYVNSEGTTESGWSFTAFGLPVMSTNDLPNSIITAHKLSDADNANAFDGDFTKTVALLMVPSRAIMAGETIALTTNAFWDQKDLANYVDSYTAFSCTPDRAEYAGIVLLP